MTSPLPPTRPLIRVVLASALVVLATAALPTAARASAGPPDQPPRVTAVLNDQKACVRSTVAAVSTPSAASQILQPARAWALTRGAGVTVAVLDTGFDLTSPQLKERVRLGPDEVSPGSTGKDCVGHGTFVAGLIVAAVKKDSTVAGIAPQAKVLGIKVTDGTGATSPDVLAQGLRAAVRRKAAIIVVSVVSSRVNARLRAAVNAAQAQGAIVIAPAVADDQDLDTPVYPAALDGVIAVNDSTAANPALSSTGSASGTRTAQAVTADLTAPGQAVLSTCPGGGVCIGTGAAYAAALVAGTAALMDAYHPGLSRSQRLARLTGTAYPVQARTSIPSAYGVVDPYAAVSAVLPAEDGVTAAGPTTEPVTAMAPPRAVPAVNTALIEAGGSAALLLLALAGVAVARVARTRRGRDGNAGELLESGPDGDRGNRPDRGPLVPAGPR